ncbi:MAG: hypothetical protein KAQ65_10440 [Candidatus Thorarchaeota archaeon]|nr:hypothetical protein [Candidatus Thorarchaeota archaeon]
MESNDTKIDKDFDSGTVKYLLGELGILTLNLIAQGCTTNDDLMRLSTLTSSCLEVKIPLLETLSLIINDNGIYSATPHGAAVLREITGWIE